MNHFHRHLSQYVSNILTVPFVTDTIVFSSNAGAAEYVGGALGEFVRTGELNGRPYYKQRDTEGKVDIFLYSALCAVRKVYFSAQPNKLRHILNFDKYYPIEHIFVPACSSARKIHFFKF